jgi:transposase-like protein
VTVFYDGKEHWLADGFHRVAAVRQLGLDRIACDVRPGTLSDAQWYSFSVNKSHGLRRTNDDKIRAVKAALRHCQGERGDSEIARHVGVSHTMVAKYREKLEAAAEIHPRSDERTGVSCKVCKIDSKDVADDPPARVVTRNGTTYPMKTGKIGSAKKTKKVGGISKDAAVPFRKPAELIPTLNISIPLNNPDAAGRTLVSNCEPAYLRSMIETILSLLNERK